MSRKRVQINIGDRFNRWTVIGKVEGSSRWDKMYLCKCDCGTERMRSYSNLIYENCCSCGCLTREVNSNNLRKYPEGLIASGIYYRWEGLKRRCYSKSCREYKNVGAKGITMCEEWRNDFMSFYNWAVSNGYSDNLQIVRIDSKGNFEPSNCRWGARNEVAKSSNICVEYNGETHTVATWANILGIKPQVLYQRIHAKWSVEKAFTTPVKIYNRQRKQTN